MTFTATNVPFAMVIWATLAAHTNGGK